MIEMKKIEMSEVEVQTQPDGRLKVTFNVLIDPNKKLTIGKAEAQ